MRTHTRTSGKSIIIASTLAVFLIIAVAGAIYFSGKSRPYRAIADLDIEAIATNALSIRGNTYRLDAEVADSLFWSPSMGRLIAVSVSGGQKVLPVLVTTEFSSFNIQKGQKLILLLEVDDKGLLRTKGVTKA